MWRVIGVLTLAARSGNHDHIMHLATWREFASWER